MSDFPKLPCFPCPHHSACCTYGSTVSPAEAKAIIADLGEGKVYKNRYTIKEVSPTEYTFKWEMSEDGTKWETLAEGKESFTVTRNVALEFTGTDPLGLNPPGWGDGELGGNYRETITGLHRSAIHISGTFRLVRVAPVAALNDGQNVVASTGGTDR